VGEFLQPSWMGALQKSVGALLEINSLFSHADRQPVMLIEANRAQNGK
jgi:hypothetical protein